MYLVAEYEESYELNYALICFLSPGLRLCLRLEICCSAKLFSFWICFAWLRLKLILDLHVAISLQINGKFNFEYDFNEKVSQDF